MREIGKLALRLLMFCLAAAVLLAATNAVTKGPIAEQAEQIAQNARKQVLTEASAFEQLEGSATEAYPHLTAVYKGTDREGVVGYTFSLKPMGFKAVIEMTLGINSEGAITALSVDSQSETAGLGTKITTDAYLNQYRGAAADPDTLHEQVDGITGATVTSKAVISAVVEAASYAENELGLVGKADPALSGSQYLSEDEMKLVSLIDGGRTISALMPYQVMGYDALTAVYQVDVRGADAYVVSLYIDGEDCHAAIDQKGLMTLYDSEGQVVEGCENLSCNAEMLSGMDEALWQAADLYNRYLAEREG